jgi:hypothetical protein
METSGGVIRGNVDSLVKVIGALGDMGVELIGEGSPSTIGGRGVRLRDRDVRTTIREHKLGANQPPIQWLLLPAKLVVVQRMTPEDGARHSLPRKSQRIIERAAVLRTASREWRV